MKKNIMCVLLSLVLVLGLMVIAAPNAFATEGETTEPAGHTHCICVRSEAKPADHVCDETIVWEPYVKGMTLVDGGHYYLTGDVGETRNLTSSSNKLNITICLNGHTFRAQTPFKVQNGNTLTICDCQGGGAIRSSKADGTGYSVWAGYNKAVVNLYSGILSGQTTTTIFTRPVVVEGGTFNMYGGTIKNGDSGTVTTGSPNVGYGGNVLIKNYVAQSTHVGTFNLYGGTIEGGKATADGGNIYVIGGALNVYGGTIRNGNAKNGGNIAANGDGRKVDLTLSGGIIENGVATVNGGNIFMLNTTNGTLLSVKKDAQILGGSAVNGGNIYMRGSNPTTISGGTIKGGQASTNGGNMYAIDANSIKIEGVSITNGTAAKHGGNLYITRESMKADAQLVLKGITVSDGTAENNGGNLYIAKMGIVTLENVTCDNGSAKVSGSNVYMEGNFNVTFTGGTYSVAEGGRKYTYTYPESSTATEEEKAAFLEQVAIYGLNNASTKLVSEGGKRLDGNGGNICIAWGNNKVTETTNSETGETVKETTPNNTTINGTVITGGNATNGGALYVGNANVTIENMTAKSCGGANGRVLHISKTGVVTLKDSTLVNWGTQGSTIYNSGSLALVGEVKLDKEFNANERKNGTAAVTTGIILDVIENENAIVDITGLTAVVNNAEEGMPTVTGISMTRYGAAAKDGTKLAAAGKLATGINDTNRDFITVNNTGFTLAESDGNLYMNNATIQGIKADGAITNGGANLAEITANHKDGVLYYIVNEDMDNAGELGVSIILDLNGKTVSGASVAAGYTLQLMDNQNDDYDADKCGKITVTGDIAPVTHIIPVAGNRHYVALPNEDGSWSAHRYLAYTPSISFAPGADALGFNASFRGDTALQAQLTGYGFQMSVNDGAVKVYTKTDPFKNPAHTTLSLRVKNILANNGGEAKITGNAILVFQINGETVYADTSANSTTMKETVKIVNDMEAELNEEQKTAVYDLYTKYASVIDSWFTTEEINKIQTWGPAAE